MGSTPSTHHSQPYRTQSKGILPTHQLTLTPSDIQLIAHVMEGHCIFRIMTLKERQICLEGFQKWKYGKGAFVIRQHNTPENLYIVLEGSVSKEIDCCVVGCYSEGEYFGEQSACYGSPHSCTIRVSSHTCTLLSLASGSFLPILQSAMLRHQG